MILADTSIWIEFLRGRTPIFEHMLFLLENREIVTIEVVFGELLQGAKSSRERRLIQAYWESLRQVPLEGLWIEAGLEGGEKGWPKKGIGLIDAVILQAAQRYKSKVWTLDKKLSKQAQALYEPVL